VAASRLLCAVVNLQGGSPEGYSRVQPWHNSAIRADGSLRPEYMARLERIIDRADELGMVIMLGVFYFGQDQHLADDGAVKRAVVNTVDWIAGRGYTNVLLEIANECDGIRLRAGHHQGTAGSRVDLTRPSARGQPLAFAAGECQLQRR
jgi:hypothetical protein